MEPANNAMELTSARWSGRRPLAAQRQCWADSIERGVMRRCMAKRSYLAWP
jgi:hypothetical protein